MLAQQAARRCLGTQRDARGSSPFLGRTQCRSHPAPALCWSTSRVECPRWAGAAGLGHSMPCHRRRAGSARHLCTLQTEHLAARTEGGELPQGEQVAATGSWRQLHRLHRCDSNHACHGSCGWSGYHPIHCLLHIGQYAQVTPTVRHTTASKPCVDQHA